MRLLYLIRHGHPDFPYGEHMCLGRTDTPLGPLGRMQAALLGEELAGRGLTVFSSPLVRCRETAAPLGGEAIVVAELREQDMGPWDGLDFDTIRRDWPELYARRAAEPLLVPPGAETLKEVWARVLPALRDCLAQSRGDIAVVVHASVIQAILADTLGIPLEESRALRPPYASYAVLGYDGTLSVKQRAVLPRIALSPAVAEKLLAAAAPGEKIERHCRAVARTARRFAAVVPEADAELLCSAALLHDIARAEKDHARVGADWLRALGYPEAAAIVEKHHDCEGGELDEAGLLYLADKCVQEDQIVPLEARFGASRAKCRDDAALAAHQKRYETALALRDRLNERSVRTLAE